MATKKITKNSLVDNINEKLSCCGRQEIQSVIDEFLLEVKKSLEEGAVIELRGFGTFEPRKRKGREAARNPKTGATVPVPPHYVAAFRAGKSLHENMWNLRLPEDASK